MSSFRLSLLRHIRAAVSHMGEALTALMAPPPRPIPIPVRQRRRREDR